MRALHVPMRRTRLRHELGHGSFCCPVGGTNFSHEFLHDPSAVASGPPQREPRAVSPFQNQRFKQTRSLAMILTAATLGAPTLATRFSEM